LRYNQNEDDDFEMIGSVAMSAKPRNKILLFYLIFTALLSVGGLITSAHLMDIHYRQPGRTDEFFKTFSFLKPLKKVVPKKYFVPDVEKPKIVIPKTKEDEIKNQYNWGNMGGVTSPASPEKPKAGDKQTTPAKPDPNDIYAKDPVADAKARAKMQAKTKKETCDVNDVVSCTKVDQSKHSHIGPIAVSLIGFAGYLALIFLSIIGMIQRPARPNLIVRFIDLAAVIGFAYSLYLTYLEARVIKAYCPYCLASAGFMTLIFIAAIVRILVFDRRNNTKSPSPSA
jgi:uncharacterized membrane protein